MNARERDESGRYTETVTLEGVLDVFDRVRGPVVTSSDVAEHLDCTTEAARQKLKQLADRGDVDSRKTGRTTVWWRTGGDDDGDRDDRRDATETLSLRAAAVAGSSPDTSADADTAASRNAGGEESIGDVLDGWRPGKSLEKREQQLAAGRAALEYLRDQGVVTAAEVKAEVEPEYPVDGQQPATWWKKTAREAFRRAREAGVVEYVDGVKEWRWVGDADRDED